MSDFTFDMQQPKSGKTTGLMLKAMGEACLSGGAPVKFVDHSRDLPKYLYQSHFLRYAEELIHRLGLNLEVTVSKKQPALLFRSTIADVNKNISTSMEKCKKSFYMKFEDDSVFHVNHNVTMKKFKEMQKDYPVISGVIIQNEDGGARAIIDRGAVRHISHSEFHILLHPNEIKCNWCGGTEEPGEDGGEMIERYYHMRCHHKLVEGLTEL